MNAVEIEEAISALAEQPFDPDAFPYAFLEAFGHKATTIRRLSSGDTNKSDLGGVLSTRNIHLKVCPEGEVTATLAALRASQATTRHKVKFVLATDGHELQAEDLGSGEVVVCDYAHLSDHFGFFLALAGITTVRQIRESAFDIKATGRLNRLYVELLKDNPEWGTAARRHEMNHFMARLIFCFFAEDTGIFHGDGTFTSTIETMSAKDSSNTHEVISELFRAMNTKRSERAAAKIPRWADTFPYVNGGLFSGSTDVPRFSKIARTYLLHVGKLEWTKINPDIFGSMIQAVADDEERGALGMHYTSVPNILKVLNPLFLDDLREKLEEAGDNGRKLLNLRNRMAKIRVFDPACGSGNFLVIAYKEMRAIEAEINQRRGEQDRRTDIPLTNFRGIELRDFPAEIARLALIIAEYQCDVLYRGQGEALADFLPLDAMNWITCGNALRLDWLSICPPTGTGVKFHADDLFHQPLDQAQIDFENEGGETYICGNPPYKGSSWQTRAQKEEICDVVDGRIKGWKALDYVSGWFVKASEYCTKVDAKYAFVATKSICEGEQVPALWPFIFSRKQRIHFAHTTFKWANLASQQAGVAVIIVGVTTDTREGAMIFSETEVRHVDAIGPYLTPGIPVIVSRASTDLFGKPKMLRGNMPTDGGNFLLSAEEARRIIHSGEVPAKFVRPLMGSAEVIDGTSRACLWIDAASSEEAMLVPFVRDRIARVDATRKASSAPTTRNTKVPPYRFMQVEGTAENFSIAVPAVSSEKREFLPVALLEGSVILTNRCYALYDAPLFSLSIVASLLHRAWVSAICGKLEMRFSYSNTLGWNTFPIPALTEKNKADLATCAEDILLAREAHFPATIADLYDPEKMPEDLRAAHDRNDEVLERIYIGRRFRNDTERLEKLFEMYVKMTAGQTAKQTNVRMKA